MKVKLEKVVEYKSIIDELSDKKVIARVLLALLHNSEAFEKEIENLDKIKLKLQIQHAQVDENGDFVLDEDGQLIGKSEDDLNALISAFSDVLNEEVEIDLHTVTLSDLIEIDTSRYDILTTAEVQKLKFMIEKEEQ